MKTFSVSLNQEQAKKLVSFCQLHSVGHFFFAKDNGAYFGATKGSQSKGDFENCIIYVSGCDPEKNEGYYDTCQARFGGDDFGEHFEIDALNIFVASESKRITFKFNKRSITASF